MALETAERTADHAFEVPLRIADHAFDTIVRSVDIAPDTKLRIEPSTLEIVCLMALKTDEVIDLMRPQFLMISAAAMPIGPVRMAASSGQFDLSQLNTFLAAVSTHLSAPVTMLRNVSEFFQASTNAATSATMAITTSPIGLAVMAAFKSH